MSEYTTDRVLGAVFWFAVGFSVLCLASSLVLMTMAGCDSEHGMGIRYVPKEQKAPPPEQATVPQMQKPAGDWPGGSRFEFESVTDGGERKTQEQASGTGAGLTTNSPEAVAKHNAGAPGATIPGMTATGGDVASGFTIHEIKGVAGNPLLWVGIAGIVAAGVAIYFGLRRAAVISAVIGGAFICAAMLPAWGWIILSAAGAVAGGVYLWVEYKAKTTGDTSKSLVAAIDKLKGEHPDAYDRAKAMVAARIAGQPNEKAQRRTIARVKEQL